MVGVSRLEIRNLLAAASSPSRHYSSRLDLIISGWRTDPLFLDRSGRPKSLAIRGEKASFDHLCRKYGRDVTTRALKIELLRRGIVRVDNESLSLSHVDSRSRRELVAANSDLKFIVAQLSTFDFKLGRRIYTSRSSVVTARNAKDANVIRQLAIRRLETVLNSLAEISN